MWRLNYIKTIFGHGSAPDPAQGADNAPLVGWEGLPLIAVPITALASCLPRALVLLNSVASDALSSVHRFVTVGGEVMYTSTSAV